MTQNELLLNDLIIKRSALENEIFQLRSKKQNILINFGLNNDAKLINKNIDDLNNQYLNINGEIFKIIDNDKNLEILYNQYKESFDSMRIERSNINYNIVLENDQEIDQEKNTKKGKNKMNNKNYYLIKILKNEGATTELINVFANSKIKEFKEFQNKSRFDSMMNLLYKMGIKNRLTRSAIIFHNKNILKFQYVNFKELKNSLNNEISNIEISKVETKKIKEVSTKEIIKGGEESKNIISDIDYLIYQESDAERIEKELSNQLMTLDAVGIQSYYKSLIILINGLTQKCMPLFKLNYNDYEDLASWITVQMIQKGLNAKDPNQLLKSATTFLIGKDRDYRKLIANYGYAGILKYKRLKSGETIYFNAANDIINTKYNDPQFIEDEIIHDDGIDEIKLFQINRFEKRRKEGCNSRNWKDHGYKSYRMYMMDRDLYKQYNNQD